MAQSEVRSESVGQKQTRHHQIAAELRGAIGGGQLPVGSSLPTEAELAQRYGVSRGTVRQAVDTLRSEGLISSRQGARRTVLDTVPSQSFGELRSFAEWARSLGRTPGGMVISSRWRAATVAECGALQLDEPTRILNVMRLRSMDGVPVLLERTSYVPWIAEAVAALPADCPSVTERLGRDVGLVFGYGSHQFDAVNAGAPDANWLDVRRGSALLRRRGVTMTPDGSPVEASDDRYRPGSVVFSIRNSIGTNPLMRQLPPV
jgi:GntR family transcriptional regulator